MSQSQVSKAEAAQERSGDDQVIRPQGEGGNALSPLFITITFSGPMLSHFR